MRPRLGRNALAGALRCPGGRRGLRLMGAQERQACLGAGCRPGPRRLGRPARQAQGRPAVQGPADRAGCLWTARRPGRPPLLSGYTLRATQFVTVGELVSRVGGLALESAPGRFAGLRWPAARAGPGRDFSLGPGSGGRTGTAFGALQ